MKLFNVDHRIKNYKRLIKEAISELDQVQRHRPEQTTPHTLDYSRRDLQQCINVIDSYETDYQKEHIRKE